MIEKSKAANIERAANNTYRSELKDEDLEKVIGGRQPPATPVQAHPAGNVS
jgi:hypothetical protein